MGLARAIKSSGIEEGTRFAMKSVDCVASEHTSYMDRHSYMTNQIVHTIGMRQTAKTQITDIRFARLAKVAAEKGKTTLRRVHRIAGKMSGKRSEFISTKLDLMYLATKMHKAMVK